MEKLLKNNIKIVEERSRKHLEEYLGESFKDIFIIHALYAFFARAKRIPDNLKSSFESALKNYSTREYLEEISNIRILEEILKKENQRKNVVIPWDYTRKILKSQENVIRNILSLKKNLDKSLKEVTEEIKSLQENLKKEKDILKENIKKITDIEIAKFENDLLEFLYEAIEYEYDEKKIEEEITYRQKLFSASLEKK
ncbi:hypothetical protein [Persephonella sp.]|uniref:hypothetical protein n=1 Tax=Persephonella sp. TaxID=2060922 RepID=UPI00262F4C2F|nr:hypothetical protein [Persephonella sp.]